MDTKAGPPQVGIPINHQEDSGTTHFHSRHRSCATGWGPLTTRRAADVGGELTGLKSERWEESRKMLRLLEGWAHRWCHQPEPT